VARCGRRRRRGLSEGFQARLLKGAASLKGGVRQP
jgi:hypothetical protein